jgi:hypothetical protein
MLPLVTSTDLGVELHESDLDNWCHDSGYCSQKLQYFASSYEPIAASVTVLLML